MPLGTWALVCNGTFFAALGLRTRNRELLLPLILFPVSIPALLSMMTATTAILTGESGRDLDTDAGGLQHCLHYRLPTAV